MVMTAQRAAPSYPLKFDGSDYCFSTTTIAAVDA
jgi:hypothetical protein